MGQTHRQLTVEKTRNLRPVTYKKVVITKKEVLNENIYITFTDSSGFRL